MARDEFAEFERAEAARKLAGQVDGRHFSTYAPEVKVLLEAGDDDAAAGLLLRLIDAVEREGQIPLAGTVGVPMWYSNELAGIYKRHGKHTERALLIQRMTVLDIKVQTAGRLAHARLKAQAASRPARRLPANMPGWVKGVGAMLVVIALAQSCAN